MSANIVQFKSRKDLAALEAADAARGRILVCRTILPDTEWKRRRWVVIVAFLDGSSEWHGPVKDERAADFVAGIQSGKYGFPIIDLGAF